jgi:hypothetical protein
MPHDKKAQSAIAGPDGTGNPACLRGRFKGVPPLFQLNDGHRTFPLGLGLHFIDKDTEHRTCQSCKPAAKIFFKGNM